MVGEDMGLLECDIVLGIIGHLFFGIQIWLFF